MGVWKQIRRPGPGGPLADQPGDPDPEIAPKENMFEGSGKVLNTPDAHFAYIISGRMLKLFFSRFSASFMLGS